MTVHCLVEMEPTLPKVWPKNFMVVLGSSVGPSKKERPWLLLIGFKGACRCAVVYETCRLTIGIKLERERT